MVLALTLPGRSSVHVIKDTVEMDLFVSVCISTSFYRHASHGFGQSNIFSQYRFFKHFKIYVCEKL